MVNLPPLGRPTRTIPVAGHRDSPRCRASAASRSGDRERKTATGILPRFWFLRQAPVTAFRVAPRRPPRSRPYRACRMWWPHTQGCASLALGWRMLAFQAKETTATTAKNTAGTAVLLTGGDARATSDNGEERGQGCPRIHEGGTPSLQDDNGEEHGRDGRATHGRDARATSDNGEERGQDARGTRGRDALATGRQRRRTRPGRPCYSRA
jgi:hypothetical protein